MNEENNTIELTDEEKGYRRGYTHGFTFGQMNPNGNLHEVDAWSHSDELTGPPYSTFAGISFPGLTK